MHTPFPWRYEYGAVYANKSLVPVRLLLADRNTPETHPCERDANCRLAAAAPFLLLAAEEIRAEAANGLHQRYTGGMELLFQAIDQATGQDHEGLITTAEA